MIKAGLLKLGLITDTKREQYRMWYTHGPSHYIGIDVHDVGDRNAPARAGHGVHDRAGHLHPAERARRAAADARERRAHREDPAGGQEVPDIGVRIEDSFLLEESGLRRLSAAVPRTIEEIEAFMKPRGSK